MLDSRYPVDILATDGSIVNSKPRISLDEHKDIYHSVNILLVTPRGELVIQTIPRIGKFGTIVTVKRAGETASNAAARAMRRQLFIDEMRLIKLGGKMRDLADGRRLFVSAYYGIADPPPSFSLLDIESLVVMTPRQLDSLVSAEGALDHVAINLYTIWKEYRNKLPL